MKGGDFATCFRLWGSVLTMLFLFSRGSSQRFTAFVHTAESSTAFLFRLFELCHNTPKSFRRWVRKLDFLFPLFLLCRRGL
jgi:hypothetical protein